MPYRILSLDGGGSWALIQVRALQEMYGPDALGRDVLKRFDLVAANSGGSIVAATLAANWKLSDTLNFFHNESARKSVFVQKGWLQRLEETVLGLGPRYFTSKKFDGLSALLGAVGNMPMDVLGADIAASNGKPTHLMIVGFDYDRKRSVYFRTNTRSAAASLDPAAVPTLAEAVHASSTAPINYFDEPATFASPGFAGRRFWDGGLTGMNNPVLAATTEALANGIAPADIQVLSLGTGTVNLPLAQSDDQAPPLYSLPPKAGLINDVKATATTILDDPPDAATFVSHVALGQPLPKPGDATPVAGNVVRLNPMVQPIIDPATGAATCPPFDSPGSTPISMFSQIAALEMDAVENSQVALIDLLATTWIKGAVYNQPIRAGKHCCCEVGHRWFVDGKSAWLSLAP